MKNTNLIYLASLFPFVFSALAADNPVNNPEVQAAAAQTDEAMRKSVEQMQQTFQQVMPQLTETMNKSVNDILASFPQLIAAIEKNQVLSKTSEQMLQDLQKSLNDLNLTVNDYNIQNINNKISISGAQNQKDVELDFFISQDPLAIALTKEYIANTTSPNKSIYKDQKITTLNNREIPLKNFQIETINGNYFLCFDENNYTFIIGNLGYNANVKIQTTGSNHKNKARDFIKSINPNHVK